MRHHFEICEKDNRRTRGLSGVERSENLGRPWLPPRIDHVGHIEFVDPKTKFACGNVAKETLTGRRRTVEQDPRRRVHPTAQRFAPRPDHAIFETPTIVGESSDIDKPEK